MVNDKELKAMQQVEQERITQIYVLGGKLFALLKDDEFYDMFYQKSAIINPNKPNPQGHIIIQKPSIVKTIRPNG